MGQTVLVVDDSMLNLRVATNILKEHFEVICAKSGVDAFEEIEKQIPDLILLDYHMPVMDGFEFIQKLRGIDEYKDIPIIMLTADNDRDTEVRGFQAGVMDFIAKPFVNEIMVQRVARILELSRYESGQIPINKEPFEIYPIAERLLERIFEGRAVNVDNAVALNTVCFADLSLIEQALNVFLENAAAHTPEGGRVTVKTEDTGGKVRISVFNTGSHICAC